MTKSFKKRVKKTLNKIFGKKKKNENLNLNQNQNIIKINVGDVKKSKTKRRVLSNKKNRNQMINQTYLSSPRHVAFIISF